MAKRKNRQTGSVIKKLLKVLPAALLIMVISTGICFGVLIETGHIRPDELQGIFGNTVFEPVKKEKLSASAKDFSVNVIDVGQGDSILILAGDKSILIDAGEKEYGDKVVSFLSSRGVKKLDYIIVTHPHSDHIGGMAQVIDTFGAEKILLPRLPDEMVPTTRSYENFLGSVKNSGCRLTAAKAGNIYEICEINGSPVIMTILSPAEDASFTDMNDYSVCVRLDYGKISWLLTGDLSKEGEKALVESGADIDVTAYKVGHHGSSTSSSGEMLEMITPRLCVISCGKDNSNGHPHDAVLKRLSGYTESIYRTDISSDVSVYSDGQKLYIAQ